MIELRVLQIQNQKNRWLVLFTWWNYDKQYWHIAVVTSVNWDWTINITESNLNGEWKVTNRTVWVNEVTWFYNNTPLAWTSTYKTDAIPHNLKVI